jgi:hypothetical protein
MRLDCQDFVRNALMQEITLMLQELGNPELVNRIYPNGWQNNNEAQLRVLYDLCWKTFRKREKLAEKNVDI